MSDIAPIAHSNAPAHTSGTRVERPETPPDRPGRGRDRVELSETAQLLSQLRALPDVRQGLVARVRAEIEAGTYETPEKLDAAVHALAEDLL